MVPLGIFHSAGMKAYVKYENEVSNLNLRMSLEYLLYNLVISSIALYLQRLQEISNPSICIYSGNIYKSDH